MAQSSVETYPVTSIAEHFGRLTDPRMEERVGHRLLDIIVIAICGVICGAESWVEIEELGKARQEWLKRFLKEDLLIRRINIRQVDIFEGTPLYNTVGNKFIKKNKKFYWKWRNEIRQ